MAQCRQRVPGAAATGPRPRTRAASGGFTFLEILVATAVLATSALIAFPTLLSFFDLSKMARDQNIVTHDLEAAVEDMMATPFSTLTATYVDGEPIPKYSELHLPEQQIEVRYEDPSRDPLSILLVATWRDSRGRDQREEMRFMRTQ